MADKEEIVEMAAQLGTSLYDPAGSPLLSILNYRQLLHALLSFAFSPFSLFFPQNVETRATGCWTRPPAPPTAAATAPMGEEGVAT